MALAGAEIPQPPTLTGMQDPGKVALKTVYMRVLRSRLQGPLKFFKGRTILEGLFGPVFLTGTAKNGYFAGLTIYAGSARYCFKEGKTGGTEGPLPPPSTLSRRWTIDPTRRRWCGRMTTGLAGGAVPRPAAARERSNCQAPTLMARTPSVPLRLRTKHYCRRLGVFPAWYLARSIYSAALTQHVRRSSREVRTYDHRGRNS